MQINRYYRSQRNLKVPNKKKVPDFDGTWNIMKGFCEIGPYLFALKKTKILKKMIHKKRLNFFSLLTFLKLLT